MSRTAITRCLVVVLFAAALGPDSRAEDVAKKWRVSFGVGGYNSQHDVPSNSANVLQTFDPCLRTLTCPVGIDNFSARTDLYRDPRNDSATFGTLGLESAGIGTVAVQYALNSLFVLEGSVGYQRGDIGDAEVAVQFVGDAPLINEIDFNFRTFRFPVGEMTRVPIQLTALARLRPRARFNPYFGAGIGYDINGFEPSSEINELSLALDGLQGRQMRVTSSFDAGAASIQAVPGASVQNLTGASVDIRDSFAWHAVAGAELSLKKKWALFLDLRWIDASRSVGVSFNGSDELGRSVPNFSDYNDSPLVPPFTEYGPVQILNGGLIDAGQLFFIPKITSSPGTNCNDVPTDCELVFVLKEDYATRLPEGVVPNGLPDPGLYYVQGGRFAYDGFALQFGFRYTFK